MINLSSPLILVTGATGYIGGRLVPRLLALGCRVRCLVRDPARLQGRAWYPDIEIVTGDLLKPESLPPALEGVQVAYYLVHSMAAGVDYEQRDVRAARNFGVAARAANVDRIIFLGGLAHEKPDLSQHLHSRLQTGDVLRESGVAVTEFRASVIVGSGSLSFEMIRYLTERLPIIPHPRWVHTRAQPIGVRSVRMYLTAALTVPESRDRIIGIGGAEVVTYAQMITIYAEMRGLRRWLLPVPFLSARLAAFVINLITPIPGAIALPLIEGLHNESVVRTTLARELFPEIEPADYRTTVERALTRMQETNIETAWSDALSSSQREVSLKPVRLDDHQGLLAEHRQRLVPASPAAVYKVFTGIGGNRGWFYMNWTWRIRGFIDRLLGGVGLRRGRRDADELRVGDALDFWRVEVAEPDHLLRLRAEMKVPGKAWLEFRVVPAGNGSALLSQTAFFEPKGVAGLLYWYALYPIHGLIFSGLIDQIARRAVAAGNSG
jgi:uncharacterized protein YbjT (DUF2867 family)